MNQNLTTLARDIHKANVEAGWWDEWPVKEDRFREARMLTVSELSEAMEGIRKSLPDDKLPLHDMFAVELADTLIRLLDLAGAYCIACRVLSSDIETHTDEMKGKRPAEQLDHCVSVLYMGWNAAESILSCIHATYTLAGMHGYDILPIIEEKRAYNAKRADHKRENRAKAGGKKF